MQAVQAVQSVQTNVLAEPCFPVFLLKVTTSYTLLLTMPSYKLIYFNLRGRGEMIRLMFAAAGVQYEDCRLTKEEFLKLKEGIL